MKNAGKQTGDRARMNRQMATEIQRQRERQQNNDMMTESVGLVSLWSPLLTFRFQTDLGSENSASHLKIQAGKTD